MKEKEMADTAVAPRTITVPDAAEMPVAGRLARSVIDKLISTTAAIVAFALVALGAAAIFGGSFAMDNVGNRLEPQNITFPPIEAMSPEEQTSLGSFAGTKVETGIQAEAYSRYIEGHLADINDGATYSETSSALRAVDAEADPALAAELGGKREALFMGETLRAILLNAYGWWVVGQVALFAGIGMVVLGFVLAILAFFGFRHARKVSPATT